jgi:hypothetical protein
MQLQKIKFLVIGAAMLSFSVISCNKDKDIQPAPVPARQLTSLSQSGNLLPLNFSYDNTGRLIEASNAATAHKYVYGNHTLQAAISDANHFIYFEYKDGKLDNAGRLLEATTIYHQPNQPDASSKMEIACNAEGYATQYTSTSLGTGDIIRHDFGYANGNLVSDVTYYNGLQNSRIEYTYYDSLPNKLLVDVEKMITNLYSDGINGKINKNLLKTQTIYNSQNVKTSEYLNTYDLDSRGYPVNMKKTDVLHNFESSRGYSYNN